MTDESVRLHWLLTRFGEEPSNPDLTSIARDLADRFTLDQLERMAPHNAQEIRPLFDQLLGRLPWTRPGQGARGATSRALKEG